MKLLIKQRVFAITDTYDVYDEQGRAKYFVKNELFALLHNIHVKDKTGQEVGSVHQKLTLFLPRFQVEITGRQVGNVQAEFTLFRPKYTIDYMGWKCEGDIFGWDYSVYDRNTLVMTISKKLLHWGDTYELDFSDPVYELPGLMLVIAIDAANCSQQNS